MSTDNKISMRSTRMGQIAAVMHFLQRAQEDSDALLTDVADAGLDPKTTPELAEQVRLKLSALRHQVNNAIRVIDMVNATLKNPGNGE